MKKLLSPLFPLSLALLSACSSAPKDTSGVTAATEDTNPTSPAVTGKESVLTRDEAMYRARQIRKITYQLWLSVDEAAPEFMGRIAATFEVREDADRFLNTLRMDFTGGKIQNLRLNQEDWPQDRIRKRYDGQRIQFKISELLKGQNRVEVTFTRPYSKTGNGLYRYRDPVDGKSYVFTNLEPNYANLIFPCFDQPDLKASYELTVEAPTDWEVVGNMADRDVTKVSGRLSWAFPPSPLFSTYLFALHAGPFKVWKADAEGIPLRLFARESEAKHVDPENWFSVTKKGLTFFADYFGSPYPYGKYDQVIVPNLNAGAMENIAAVTFNEKFTFKSKPTQSQLLNRANVILHEMAHMWFGNLVTMRWWNGLWLNESFATYLAHVAVKELKLFPGLVDETFYRSAKEWAYFEDSLVTNHPIEVSVADTSQAFTLFDGITYGKGAAALQQLHHYVGDDDFREGLHRYFQKFANRNTVLNDLIQSLSVAASKDLGAWQKAWLQTKGTNEAEVKLQCSGDRVESLSVVQTAPGEGNVLRPHQLNLAFYQVRQNAITRGKDTFSVTLSGSETPVPTAIGKPCPELVFVNDGDLGFICQSFSAADIEVFKKHLSAVQPTLNRQMIWSNLINGVRRGIVSATDFDQIARNHLPQEKSPELITSVSNFLFSPRANAFTVLRILPASERQTFLRSWHPIAAKRLGATPAGSDLQVAWFDLLAYTVHDSASATALQDLATGMRKIPGLSMGVDRAYQALRAAARVSKIPEEAYQALGQQFTGEEALNQEIRTRAVEPESEQTHGVFALMTRERKDPAVWADASRLRKVMPLFLHPLNEARTRAWTPVYLQSLVRMNREADATYAENFTEHLYPALCEEAQMKTIEAGLSPGKLPAHAVKAIRQARQLDQECVRARAQVSSSLRIP